VEPVGHPKAEWPVERILQNLMTRAPGAFLHYIIPFGGFIDIFFMAECRLPGVHPCSTAFNSRF
jgi:hypothetical protein